MSEKRPKRNHTPENERKSNHMPTTSTQASTRITIEQKVSSGAKKGPLNIKCSVDPKDVVIQRRFGEGSKPLFSRDDIRVNAKRESSTTPTRRGRRERSSSDSSEERTRPTTTTVKTRREKSQSPKGKKTPDKIPYFIDARREEDRLRAKYGHSHRTHKTRSRSPSRRRSRTRSRSPRRNRRRSRSRNRQRYRSRSRSRSRRRHRSYDRNRRSLSRDRYRNRSSSRGRSRRRSPYPEQRYIPVAIPVEYPCPAGWIAPPMPPYPRNPFMLRPPIPFYPLRPPFAPMDFPIRPPRFPGRQLRPYRPGPPKPT